MGKWDLYVDGKREVFLTYEGAESRLNFLAEKRVYSPTLGNIPVHRSLWLTKHGKGDYSDAGTL